MGDKQGKEDNKTICRLIFSGGADDAGVSPVGVLVVEEIWENDLIFQLEEKAV